MWRGSTGSATQAIDRIDLKAAGGGNWTTGTTFSLYGIRREGVSPAPKATGGVISSDSTYYYHTFPATGVFTPSQSLTCDYFVVAGGGGAGATVGGGWAGGGGGAGGYRTFTGVSFASGTAYTATVGAGGTGGSGSGGFGNKGSNTTLIGGAISTATTGGGGGGTSKENGNTQTDGRTGGSGGGAPQNTIAANGGAGNEGGYTPVEGYAGYSYVSGDLGAGQGGGAGGVGTRAIYLQEIPFNGVTAFDSNRYSSGGAARWLTADGMNALPNTGNGGFSKNDGTGTNYTGGTGGSGIVVIRYLKA
jgi:MSHA biogenesis protein MshQ